MPRYPDYFIEEVRERVDLLGLVGRHVQLKKSGVNWQGLCPFHREKTPSFSVRPDKGFFKCFGCGQGGDAFGFLMKIRGMGFNEAVEELATVAGLALPVMERGSQVSQEKTGYRDSLYMILSRARDYFQSRLTGAEGQKALDYLGKRGLTDKIIQKFRLGYAPAGWQGLADHFKDVPNAQKLLEEAGLRINKGDGSNAYDRFRDRVIFPIHDIKGRCVGFGGRTMEPDGKPKYINSPETVLYQKGQILYGLDHSQEAIQKRGEIILVEGYMDLISLASHGIENVAATLGTALTDDQLRLIWQRSRRVVYCFDGDHAGRQAAWKALEKSIDGLEADRHIRFLFLPQGSDPDQFIRHQGYEKFLALVEKAIGLVDFLSEKLGMDLALAQPEGRAAFVHRVRPYLERISDPLLKDLMAQSVAKRIDIPPWMIFRGFRPGPLLGQRDKKGSTKSHWTKIRGEKGRGEKKRGEIVEPPVLDGRDLERTLLGLLLRFPGLISEHEEELAKLAMHNQQFSGLLETLIAMGPEILAEGNILKLQDLPNEEVRGLARMVLECEEVVPEFPDKELQNCLALASIRQIGEGINRQVDEGDVSDHTIFGGVFRKMSALCQERNRLVASRSSHDH